VYIKGRYIVSACALLFVQQAMAAGMDCTKAANAVENTVCANKSLYELDAQMGVVYRGLMKVSADAKSELKTLQRQWLNTRGECTDDVSCLEHRYSEHLQVLKAQWKEAVVYKPNDIDKQALDDLQKRTQAASKSDPQFALERTLASLAIKSPLTMFNAEPDEGEYAEKTHFPKTAPKGVTQSEWKALLASNLGNDTEQGQTTFNLLDLNEDGQRDLIVQTYTGGTGLFSFFETYRRDGDRFIRRTAVLGEESGVGSSLYSISDRGANQSGNWISIRGKVYAAYRDSNYGVDQVYLLSPLQVNVEVPTLTVRYRYQLSIPRNQTKEDNKTTYTLEPKLQRALAKGLATVGEESSDTGGKRKPLCPIPRSAEDPEEYYGYGAGYYVIETIADFPVTIGNECFIARLNDHFGNYGKKDGLYAQLTMRKPGSIEQEREYQVHGRRRITQVSTSMGKAGGGAAD
jgi:uncharacterized protein